MQYMYGVIIGGVVGLIFGLVFIYIDYRSRHPKSITGKHA